MKQFMIKWGTCGQQIWGTYARFWQHHKFYTFPISFEKEEVFDN
jgi:hypothetical protein